MIIYHFEGWAINGGLGNNHQVETLHEGEKQPSKELSPPLFVKTLFNHTQHCFDPLPKLWEIWSLKWKWFCSLKTTNFRTDAADQTLKAVFWKLALACFNYTMNLKPAKNSFTLLVNIEGVVASWFWSQVWFRARIVLIYFLPFFRLLTRSLTVGLSPETRITCKFVSENTARKFQK